MPSRPGWPRVWWAYLACGAVVAVAYYLAPATDLAPRWAAKIGLYNGLGLSAVAAIAVGVARHRPERPLPWYLFATGLLSYVTADIIFYTYQDILHLEVFPSAADVFYLAAYPFLMAGLLLLIRSRSPGADRASLLDALVVTVGLGMVSWVFLVGPLAQAPDLTLAERLVSMAYPIVDVLVLATAVRLVVDGGPRPPAFWILCSGVGALLVTDTLYSIIQLSGGYHTGSPIDLGWMTWYACWGAAALHPTMRDLAEPAPPREARLGPWRLGLLAGRRCSPRRSRWCSCCAAGTPRGWSPRSGRWCCSGWSWPACTAWPARWPPWPRPASGCSTRPCGPARRSGSGWPPTSTTGRSSASAGSPTPPT